MSFPSRTSAAAVDEAGYRRYKGRSRSSSFTHYATLTTSSQHLRNGNGNSDANSNKYASLLSSSGIPVIRPTGSSLNRMPSYDFIRVKGNTSISSSSSSITSQQHQNSSRTNPIVKSSASQSNFLTVNTQSGHGNGAASSIEESDESDGEDLDDDFVETLLSDERRPEVTSRNYMAAATGEEDVFVETPSPLSPFTDDNSHNQGRRLAHSLKEKLNITSRKSTTISPSGKKSVHNHNGSSKNSHRGNSGVFSTFLSHNSHKNSTSAGSASGMSQQQQLYDDGSAQTYPPPQKQSNKRDQYGFLKSSQWITDEAYNEFETFYEPIMKRRLQKWRQLLSENNEQWPPRSSKLKRYIRKGIPVELRGQAWLHYSGAKVKLEANEGVYEELVRKAEALGNSNENLDIIERDLHRTFPENDKFRPDTIYDEQHRTRIPSPDSPNNIPTPTISNTTDTTTSTASSKDLQQQPAMIQSLRRVLLAFSIYSPSIGYCQSLNYIAGMLLLFLNEEEAFWTFVTLIQDILPPNIYDVTMEGANIDQHVFMILISERYPHIWNRLSGGKTFWECEDEEGDHVGGMPTCSLVTSHWFLTLFINILPVESVLRVWDCLFYDGQKVLFRVALGIFKLNENEILAVQDPLEVFQVVQNMPKRMVDCHKLIDGTYLQYASATRVSDEEIKERRELFKKRRDERRRNIPVEKRGKLLKRGTVRGAIIHRAKEAKYFVERAKTVRKGT